MFHLLFCPHKVGKAFSDFFLAFISVKEVIKSSQSSDRQQLSCNAWRRSFDIPERRYVFLAVMHKNIFSQ